MDIENGIDTLYIKETRRHFLKPDCTYIAWFNQNQDEQIIVIPLKAAWGIDANALRVISKRYNIDFKIYAFECGMKFNQDIEIIKGIVKVDDEIKYDNYYWDCIEPDVGG